MFRYNNTHIFTGYLKQLLSSVNIPTCKIYTNEFARYLEQHGKEDPRIIESFDTISNDRLATRVNYLKNNELYNYFWNYSPDKEDFNHSGSKWRRVSTAFYDSDKVLHGLTKTLCSPGHSYDTITHEYLGEYLRFLRDYYNINLMSLYNCFNNKICNNIYFSFIMNPDAEKIAQKKVTFDSQDSKYRIYAIPVKLFENYTVAIDCSNGVELFCGLYNTNLDTSNKASDLISRTYKKINKALFNQPFLYDKLAVENWTFEHDTSSSKDKALLLDATKVTRWDVINREQDLRLFIKVPTSCKSSIVILEGDFKHFNDFKYIPQKISESNVKETWHFNDFMYSPTNLASNSKHEIWTYQQNHSIINFGNKRDNIKIDLNTDIFIPVGKIQLLAFNTGESYPFADKLVEYLSGSAITSIDEIPDNIKRVQRVMEQNKHYFTIEGLWENKMQKIIYDYIVNAGPVELVAISTQKDSEDYGKIINPVNYTGTFKYMLLDKRRGYHPRLGHTSKSLLYDTLGYIDKDTEKWYTSWTKADNKATPLNSVQNVDIYDGLYDI